MPKGGYSIKSEFRIPASFWEWIRGWKRKEIVEKFFDKNGKFERAVIKGVLFKEKSK